MPERLPNYANPEDPGNRIRPRVRCRGCGKLGCTTAWGAWCFSCNVARLDRITAKLQAMGAQIQLDKP